MPRMGEEEYTNTNYYDFEKIHFYIIVSNLMGSSIRISINIY